MSIEMLEVAYYGLPNPLELDPAGLTGCLDVFDHSGALRPDALICRKTEIPFSVGAGVELLKRFRAQKFVTVDFVHSRISGMKSSLTFVPDGPPGFSYWAIIPMSAFAGTEPTLSGGNPLVDLLLALARQVPAEFACAHPQRDLVGSQDPAWSSISVKKQIREAYWLNIYGAPLVHRAPGRIRSVPAARREDLPDGGLLWMPYQNPSDYLSLASRQAQARALCHLRPSLDYPTLLRDLIARSESLSPVRPQFASDVADLFSAVVAETPTAERAVLIRRCNDIGATAVDERLEPNQMLPSDVDSAAAVRRYQSEYIEELFMLLHDLVPEVMSMDPASLTRVELAMWKQYPPEKLTPPDRERIIRAVGAWVGEILVRRAGGKWIPRKDLDETQVQVGQIRWLPFLRARHWFQSRDAMLEHSLVRFFHSALREGAGI